MTDITITVTINDWRDVPFDDRNRRQRILNEIAGEAAYCAIGAGDDHDVVVQATYEVHDGS